MIVTGLKKWMPEPPIHAWRMHTLIFIDRHGLALDSREAFRAYEAVEYSVTLSVDDWTMYVKADLDGIITSKDFAGLNLRLWVPHCCFRTRLIWIHPLEGDKSYRYQLPKSIFYNISILPRSYWGRESMTKLIKSHEEEFVDAASNF